MKRMIIGLFVAAALLFLLGRGRVTASQEGGPSPTRDENAQLAEQVKVLESELKALTDKYEQSAGFSDTKYVLRIQRHYEEYYEKVLSTQTNMMWAVGILLTVLLGVAGVFSVRQFDRQIDFTTRRVAAEQRVEFERRLEADLRKLEKENDERVTKAVHKLDLQRDYDKKTSWGVTCIALNQLGDAVQAFREALEIYLRDKDHEVFAKEQAAQVIRNLFTVIGRRAGDKFNESAKKELQLSVYKELKEELSLAAESHEDLARMLSETEHS